MSTLRAVNIQHPNALTPNISLTASVSQSLNIDGNIAINGNIGIKDTINLISNTAPTSYKRTNIGNYSDGNFVIARHNDDGTYRGNVLVSWNNGSLSLCTSIDGSERVKIDTSGRMNVLNQPIFSARGGNNPGTLGSVIVYGIVDFNIGSHYNATNGRFTAPIAGNYFFSFHGLLTNANTSDSRLVLCKNGSGAYGLRFILDKTDASWNTIQGFGIIPLAANDFVTIQLDVATQMHTDSGYDGFMGYLLG